MIVNLEARPGRRPVRFNHFHAKTVFPITSGLELGSNGVILVRHLLAGLLFRWLDRLLSGLSIRLGRRRLKCLWAGRRRVRRPGGRVARIVLIGRCGLALSNTDRHGGRCKKQHAAQGRSPHATNVFHFCLLDPQPELVRADTARVERVR